MNKWVYLAAGAVLTILAVVGLGNLIRFVISSPPKPLDGQNSVATEWNTSVQRLSINPVYPPQEDVHVGDIFAVIKQSDESYPTSVVFADHAIKLWHVDMTEALKAAYDNVPVFPPTQPHPAHDDDIWNQNGSDDLFHLGNKRTLSLVAFPAFTIHHSRSATAGVSSGSGVAGWFSGLFGFMRDDRETEQLSFPAAETYGVNSIHAELALFSFCSDLRTKPFCTDRAVRSMLSMVVGNEIWRPQIEPKTQKPTGRYASEVELMLVKQVFLTRSIVHLRAADSASGQTARLVAKLKEISQRPPAPTTSSPTPDSASPSGQGSSSLPAAAPESSAVEQEKKNLVE